MTAQLYVHEILQSYVLPLIQWLHGAIFQQDNPRPHTAKVSQYRLRNITVLPEHFQSLDMSPIEHIWDNLGQRVEHLMNLERTRGIVAANTEGNVTRYHT
ncbi:UNVERIFIED_CONTAM: hypothetical protein NCL1_49203 [Trichonephila clavipes]